MVDPLDLTEAPVGLSAAEVAERVADGRVNDVPEAPVRTTGQILRANVLTPCWRSSHAPNTAVNITTKTVAPAPIERPTEISK